ncbi:MAG: hypothetical protein FJW37_12245, partial [Acidobacteria bacterium]|nr:hypothetical protein [Acidobacteriota bacterium]
MNPEIPRGMKLFLAMLFGTLTFLLACNIYLFLRSERTKKELTQARGALVDELSSLRRSASLDAASSRNRLDMVQQELRAKEEALLKKQRQLEAASRVAAVAASEAKLEAEKNVLRLARVAAEQENSERAIVTEISKIKEAGATTGSKLADVTSEVEATRNELSATVSDLQRVSADVETLSGLVATNAQQLGALRDLGVRNYFEFHLKKTAQAVKVGDIRLLLKKTDLRRSRYTVDLFADDRRTEKKDRSVNEPVRFHVAGEPQPYELVINEMRKDEIIGYLAAPKKQVSRR